MADDPRWQLASPRAVALRILAARFRTDDRLETSVQLADFQKDSVTAAGAVLQRRGGVLLCDSVGLGKTYVALALIDDALRRGQKAFVVVPAALRGTWHRELHRLEPDRRSWVLMSHTQLSRTVPPAAEAGSLIVVDEAHAFRNPRTHRYRVLRRLCRGSRVLLLTATPVNNSLSDLYFQLRLFCSDHAFNDLGIGSLRAAMIGADHTRDVARIREAVMVRRTRSEARAALASADDEQRTRFRFPADARTCVLSYRLPLPVPLLTRFLSSLTFPAYRMTALERTSPELLRYALLKRQESSVAAIRASLARQLRFYERFIETLRTGRLLRPRDFRLLYTGDETALQLVLDEVALPPHAHDSPMLRTAAESEVVVLREWLDALRAVADNKLCALTTLLRSRTPDRTVVFSEYRDTARYLWRQLAGRFAVGLIEGSGSWIGMTPASRRRVVECFAPRANSATVHPREAVHVLIATDVLAEGMNLQDADAVVSYDLPWNPIRLIQRAGRVDRIGSPHESVYIFNFLPDREFDAFLGLAGTIRRKLETVRVTVGLERPVLEPEETFETVVRALAAAMPDLLTRIEDGAEARLRAEFRNAESVVGTSVVVARLGDGQPKHVLVALERGVDSDVFVVELETGTEADANTLLLRALGCPQVRPLEFDRFLPTVQQQVDQANRRSETVQLGRDTASARIAQMLRRRLAELPLETGTDVFDRADQVLEKLLAIRDAGAEEELEQLTVRARFMDLHALLSALEKVFCGLADSSPTELRWALAALLVAD